MTLSKRRISSFQYEILQNDQIVGQIVRGSNYQWAVIATNPNRAVGDGYPSVDDALFALQQYLAISEGSNPSK